MLLNSRASRLVLDCKFLRAGSSVKAATRLLGVPCPLLPGIPYAPMPLIIRNGRGFGRAPPQPIGQRHRRPNPDTQLDIERADVIERRHLGVGSLSQHGTEHAAEAEEVSSAAIEAEEVFSATDTCTPSFRLALRHNTMHPGMVEAEEVSLPQGH